MHLNIDIIAGLNVKTKMHLTSEASRTISCSNKLALYWKWFEYECFNEKKSQNYFDGDLVDAIELTSVGAPLVLNFANYTSAWIIIIQNSHGMFNTTP